MQFLKVGSSLSALSCRFQVDFTCGSSVKPRADVAFHFNPRIKKSCIVCNTLTKECWGREQIHYEMPFRLEVDFELIILILKDQFKVRRADQSGVREESARQNFSLPVRSGSNWCPAMCCFPCLFRWR